MPRPFQKATNPLINDTDADGMLDGWEMQVKSAEGQHELAQPLGRCKLMVKARM